MKVVFLGTSAGWPIPRLGCNCDLCRSVDLKDKRKRPAILVNDRVLVDAGIDIYSQLIKQRKKTGWEIDELSDLLITHAHFDHISGIWDLTKIYGRKEKLRLSCPKSTMTAIRNMFGMHLTALGQNVVKPKETFMAGGLKVTYFEVEHSLTATFGVKIKGNKILAYIPDFRKIRPSSKKIIKGVDLAVFDGSSFGRYGQAKGHISMIDGVKIARELKIKRLYFTHVGHKTGRIKELEDYFISEFGSWVKVAYDGLEIEI